MPKRLAHPEHLRARACQLVVDKGKCQKDVSEDLGIPRSTLSDLVKRYRATNSSTRSIRGGSRYTVFTNEIKDNLIKLMEDDCTLTIQCIIEKLGITVHISTVWKWIKRLNYTYKIVRPVPISRNIPPVKQERKLYAEWYTGIPIEVRYRNIIFVDESPFSLHMMRNRGRALRGKTPNITIPNSKGSNVTMILAVNALNVISCEAVLGSVNGNIFQAFLAALPDILDDDDEYIIVMDNVRFHHSIQEFYDTFPYQIHFLPRYSPFLNPCEEVFSQIKSNVRRNAPIQGREDLLERMKNASQGVSENNLKSYFQHSETFFGQCLSLSNVPRD